MNAETTKKKVVKETIIDGPVKVKKAVEKNSSAQTAAGGRKYGTGKRKNSIARVWISKGNGKITVNGMDSKEYLKRPILETIIRQPLVALELNDNIDVMVTAKGGGLSGQAGAILLGIARALLSENEEYRHTLRVGGFLTRDSRIVERKKFGLHKARKARTFRKR